MLLFLAEECVGFEPEIAALVGFLSSVSRSQSHGVVAKVYRSWKEGKKERKGGKGVRNTN